MSLHILAILSSLSVQFDLSSLTYSAWHFRAACLWWDVPAVLSLLYCPGFSATVFLSKFSCSGCSVPANLSLLSCSGHPLFSVLSRRTWPRCLADLYGLTFSGCFTVLSRCPIPDACPRCPVLAVLTWLLCKNWYQELINEIKNPSRDLKVNVKSWLIEHLVFLYSKTWKYWFYEIRWTFSRPFKNFRIKFHENRKSTFVSTLIRS